MTRARILRRDAYRCQWGAPGPICGDKANEVDHKNGPQDDSDEALQSLCGFHHRLKSGGEGGRAAAAVRRRMAAQKKRPAEMHPGLMDAPECPESMP
jgi:5-methylcytosine-specific restriction protein A